MEIEDIAKEYKRMTDEELLRLTLEPEQLTSEAQAVLHSELALRQISDSERLKTFREGEKRPKEEQLRCLDHSELYAQLNEKSRRLRKYRRFALVPFAIVAFIEIVILRNPKNRLWAIPIALSVLWAGLVVCCDLIFNVRMMSIHCPRCGKKFGGDDQCFYCDLPRNSRE